MLRTATCSSPGSSTETEKSSSAPRAAGRSRLPDRCSSQGVAHVCRSQATTATTKPRRTSFHQPTVEQDPPCEAATPGRPGRGLMDAEEPARSSCPAPAARGDQEAWVASRSTRPPPTSAPSCTSTCGAVGAMEQPAASAAEEIAELGPRARPRVGATPAGRSRPSHEHLGLTRATGAGAEPRSGVHGYALDAARAARSRPSRSGRARSARSGRRSGARPARRSRRRARRRRSRPRRRRRARACSPRTRRRARRCSCRSCRRPRRARRARASARPVPSIDSALERRRSRGRRRAASKTRSRVTRSPPRARPSAVGHREGRARRRAHAAGGERGIDDASSSSGVSSNAPSARLGTGAERALDAEAARGVAMRTSPISSPAARRARSATARARVRSVTAPRKRPS